MESRRSFLARSGAVAAGLTGLPSLCRAEKRNLDGNGSLSFNLECSFVLIELKRFGEEFLPALNAPLQLRQDDGISRLVSRSAKHIDGRTTVRQWQEAIRSLMDAVPRRIAKEYPPLSAGDFLPLYAASYPGNTSALEDPEDLSYSVERGRIVWNLHPGMWGATDRGHRSRVALERVYRKERIAGDPWREIERRLPEMREWFLRLSPLSNEKMNGFYGVLPVLAEADPAFAIRAIDRRSLRAAIHADHDSTPEQKAKQLKELNSNFYAGCLCCGLAFVMEALANNHFYEIGKLLRLPEVYADSWWNGLMTELLFAVLFYKVQTLRRLSQVSPSLWQER